MKPYERNEELSDSFIQGWYLPDKFVSEILKNFQDLGELQYSDDIRGYCVATFSELPDKTQKCYLNYLNELVITYENTYKELKNLNYKLDKFINLQYWKPEKHYSKWHFEMGNATEVIYRNLVFMTYLNDISAGGETEFVYQKCKIKPKKGLTIIWPASWTHTHRGCMTKENKYAVTGWFELIPKRQDLHLDIPNRVENIIKYS